MNSNYQAPPAGRGAKAFGIAALAAFSVSCATQTTSMQSHNGSAAHASQGLLPRDFDEKRARVSALLDLPELERASFAVANVGRAQIAADAGSRQRAHEDGFAISFSVSGAKIENAPAAPGEGETPVLAQNSLQTNNGGWRETEDAFLHGYSGMRCPKELDMVLLGEGDAINTIETDLGQIKVYDTAGMDTSCDYANAEASVYLTLYASNWPDIALRDHFGASLKLIVDRFPLKSEAPVLVASTEKDESEPSTIEGDTLAAAFITEPMMKGKTFKTALWLNKTGGWHVKARATFPVEVVDGTPEFSLVEMVAATTHAITLKEVDRHINAAQTVSY